MIEWILQLLLALAVFAYLFAALMGTGLLLLIIANRLLKATKPKSALDRRRAVEW